MPRVGVSAKAIAYAAVLVGALNVRKSKCNQCATGGPGRSRSARKTYATAALLLWRVEKSASRVTVAVAWD